MNLRALGYLLPAFLLITLSIFLFYKGYTFALYKKESRKISERYVEGSFKHFWYYNNDFIFYFTGFVSLMVGIALIITCFT